MPDQPELKAVPLFQVRFRPLLSVHVGVWWGCPCSEMNVGLMARARGSSSIISTYVTSHVTSPPCATSVLNPGRLTRSVWAVRGNSLAIKMFFKKVKLLLQNRKKLRDLENKLMVARGKG